MKKYNPGEARDRSGEWTAGGGGKSQAKPSKPGKDAKKPAKPKAKDAASVDLGTIKPGHDITFTDFNHREPSTGRVQRVEMIDPREDPYHQGAYDQTGEWSDSANYGKPYRSISVSLPGETHKTLTPDHVYNQGVKIHSVTDPAKSKTKKASTMTTVAKLFIDPAPDSIEAVMAKAKPTTALELKDIFAVSKSEERPVSKYGARPLAGSFEELIQRLRDPAIAASGCTAKPPMPPGQAGQAAQVAPTHWLDIEATLPDAVIVCCHDEGKFWRVPYEIQGDDVVTGEPEVVEREFVPLDGAQGGDDDEGFASGRTIGDLFKV